MMTITLGKIASHVGAELHGDPDTVVNGLASLQSAKSGQVSFLSNRKYRRYLRQTKASAVIITQEDLDECPVSALVVDDPYLTYASVVSLFYPDTEYVPGIHPSAVISPSAKIDSSVSIGANVVIEDNAVIGSGTFLDSGCVIKADVTIGSNTLLYPNHSGVQLRIDW